MTLPTAPPITSGIASARSRSEVRASQETRKPTTSKASAEKAQHLPEFAVLREMRPDLCPDDLADEQRTGAIGGA